MLSFVFAPKLYAQTTQASFTGKVFNAQNNPLPDAAVTIKNESTGFTATTTSDAKGDYVFKELPLGGPFYILVTFTGYADKKNENYILNQGDVLL